jgi:hypothetical protein
VVLDVDLRPNREHVGSTVFMSAATSRNSA